ncbi:WD40 repeat-like protein [Laetiporus sulphureus 93-53]|uniref:WD40 repeat-like protein n=1 Tax=Laetiporus sulphureus 93-53 TaxID=1314785 RepID=A0A165ENY1_9APHY|nr:WD40 repeat-like protein [Laetiporus sulphureus 93-53]KZT07457.1 WD40 repeat-like protein [Laetiporus sulphureus 93-53]
MSFPHTHLLLSPSRPLAVVLSGPHIQVVDTQNGSVLHSTVNLDEATKASVLKSGGIRCSAVNDTFTHLVTAGDEKKLKVWKLDGLELLNARELPKKPTTIHFIRDGQTILVSDKFGDIFSYPLHPLPKLSEPSTTQTESAISTPEPGSSKRSALTSHENPSDGKLILGHVSLLTDFLLTPDERFIITADRDEHIRVSWYPQGYVIESYCLGHEKYVSALHLPPFAPSMLVSGGGDLTINLWDWLSGEPISEIPVLETVEPYIKVKAKKRRWGGDEDQGGGDGEGENSTVRRRKRGRKGRDRRRAEKGATGTEESAGAEGMLDAQEDAEMEGDQAEDLSEKRAVAQGNADNEKTVLVVHKIDSLDFGERGRFLVFNVLGATALFYCSFPQATGATSPPPVRAFDFRRPVLDFTVGPNDTTWVLLDPESDTDRQEENEEQVPLAALLSWTSGEPVRVPAQQAPALLSCLQTACAIPATAADRKALDLYSALSSLPKNVDPEHDPFKGDFEGTPEPTSQSQLKDKGKGKQNKEGELTQREQARLRKKMALAAKLQEQAQVQTVLGKRDATALGETEEEREIKRAREEKGDGDVETVAGDADAMDVS